MTTALALPTEKMGDIVNHQTCLELVRIWRFNVAKIRASIETITQAGNALKEALAYDSDSYNPFKLEYRYNGREYWNADTKDIDRLIKEMERRAWRTLIDKLEIKNIMSVKKREEFEKQLESGDLPDLTEEAVLGTIAGLIGSAQDFATEAAKEVFELLRPSGSWRKKYKTNNVFRVGKKVILSGYVDTGWGGSRWKVCYHYDSKVHAIDAVFHLMDGKGIIKGYQGPLANAIGKSDGKGETDFFKFKCFGNGNLHLEFKRLDLVKQLNGLAAGEFVLGNAPD